MQPLLHNNAEGNRYRNNYVGEISRNGYKKQNDDVTIS